RNIENVVSINSSLKNITNQLDSQDKNTELLSNILSTNDNNQTRHNIIKLRETIVPDKETFHHLQDELLLTSTVHPHTAQEVTATALLTELNQLKSQVDTASHLSTAVLDNQRLNTTITSSDKLKDNITQLHQHTNILQNLKNNNYPSAISHATRITTACHDYIHAAPATFGVIHQDIDSNDALVDPALEQAKTVLSSKLTEVTAHNTQISAIGKNPEVRAALQQQKNTLLSRINERKESIAPGKVLIKPASGLPKKTINSFIKQYDDVYNKILNSDVLSDNEKQTQFAALKAIRAEFQQINLSRDYANIDATFRQVCITCHTDMNELKFQVEDIGVASTLTNKDYYQKLGEAEKQQIVIEKTVQGGHHDLVRNRHNTLKRVDKLIQDKTTALNNIAEDINLVEAEQSTFSKFISRGFNAL
ncbi:MAG: hypothetical protein ACK4PR_13865, partial [Gammaproteobacteria bacterium]